nr:MAG TPA: hypothetical protein [Caudoviricetes sp.]
MDKNFLKNCFMNERNFFIYTKSFISFIFNLYSLRHKCSVSSVGIKRIDQKIKKAE